MKDEKKESEVETLEEKYKVCDTPDEDKDNMSSCPIGKFSNDRKKE